MNKKEERVRNIVLVVSAAVLLAACSGHMQRLSSTDGQDELQTVRVNDATLHYIERGQGTPIVFVHGALGDYRTWNGQIEAFSGRYRVISYSRRLAYPNEIPPDAVNATKYHHVADLRSLLEELSIDRLHLIGHSGGGAISLLFAREYPENLITLTLGEPAVTELLRPTPEGSELLQAFGKDVVGPSNAAFRSGNEEEGVRRFIDGVMGGEDGFDNLTPFFREAMLQNGPGRKITRFDNVSRPPFSCDDASGVRIPTLLIHGELSPKMFVSINDTLEDCLPNVERKILPMASHGLEMESPERFNQIVLEFIGRHE